jgi:hypothetical protein
MRWDTTSITGFKRFEAEFLARPISPTEESSQFPDLTLNRSSANTAIETIRQQLMNLAD